MIFFSRSKKDKTNDKRDTSEDKRNNETDSPGLNRLDSVRKIFFYLKSLNLFIKKGEYKPMVDQDFQMYLDEIRSQISNIPLSEQISNLAR